MDIVHEKALDNLLSIASKKVATSKEKASLPKLHCFDLFPEVFEFNDTEREILSESVEDFAITYHSSFRQLKKSDELNYRVVLDHGLDNMLDIITNYEIRISRLVDDLSSFAGMAIRRKYAEEIAPLFQLKKLHIEIGQHLELDELEQASAKAKVIQGQIKFTCLHLRITGIDDLALNNSEDIISLKTSLDSYLKHIPYTIKSIKKHLGFSPEQTKEYQLAERIQQLLDEVNALNILKHRIGNTGNKKDDKIWYLEDLKIRLGHAKNYLQNTNYLRWRIQYTGLSKKQRIVITELSKYDKDQWLNIFDHSYQKLLIEA